MQVFDLPEIRGHEAPARHPDGLPTPLRNERRGARGLLFEIASARLQSLMEREHVVEASADQLLELRRRRKLVHTNDRLGVLRTRSTDRDVHHVSLDRSAIHAVLERDRARELELDERSSGLSGLDSGVAHQLVSRQRTVAQALEERERSGGHRRR